MRRCLLWPETTAALKEAIARRARPKNPADADLVFLTFRGKSWTPNLKSRPLTNETGKLLDKLGITGRRNFYALRHTDPDSRIAKMKDAERETGSDQQAK